MTDCVVRSRIDPHIKEEASEIFQNMGLTLSDAIRLFLYQAVAEKRLPFSVHIPNAKTQAAIHEAKDLKNLKKTSIEQLKKAWEEACER